MVDVKVDIALEKGADGVYDAAIGSDGDFVAEYGFGTSLLNNALAERRANEGEEPVAIKRRGWIGNETPAVQGYEVGSKLWFFYQARNTLLTKNGCVDALRDATSHWVPSILKDVVITGKLLPEGVEIEVNLVRKSGKIDKLYFRLWELTGI